MKKILALLFVLIMILALTACGGGDPETDIIGRWECQDGLQAQGWYRIFTFHANGRFSDADRDEGYFSIDDSSLTLDFDDFDPITFSFSLHGDQLTITGDGLRVVLDRQ